MKIRREIGGTDSDKPAAVAKRARQTVSARAARMVAPSTPHDIPGMLALTPPERAQLTMVDALVFDPDGNECLRGLAHAESIDYLELGRRFLENDDRAFLRMIELGDRHAAALIRSSASK